MTDDESAEYLDGDYVTVEQLARLRQVTPAAVRAQLRAGNLAGEQVLQGQRTVWRIPVGAARGSLGKSAGSSSPPSATQPAPPPSTALPPTDPPPAPAPARPPARVEALEAEVRRLRRQLADLADAHRRLLDAVTSGLSEEY